MLREMLGRPLKVNLKPTSDTVDVHYAITPYSFAPKEGKKLVQTHYTDMGQGLLSVMNEVYAARKGGRKP
jgi:UDP-glucose 4-epimerase